MMPGCARRVRQRRRRRAFSFLLVRSRLEGAVALEISIVIPARDEAASIGGCLAALARQTVAAARLHVIVVAAGEDDTAGAAARASAGLGFGRFEVVRI